MKISISDESEDPSCLSCITRAYTNHINIVLTNFIQLLTLFEISMTFIWNTNALLPIFIIKLTNQFTYILLKNSDFHFIRFVWIGQMKGWVIQNDEITREIALYYDSVSKTLEL